MAEALSYQENDFGFFIKAEGHVTASVSTDLRELVMTRLSREPVPAALVVDLSECLYMDSTFMGLLVGFHKRFRALTNRALSVLQPTDECVKLLQGLGILRLMHVIDAPMADTPTVWISLHPQRSPNTEILLTAHRNLSELSAENERQFSALEEVLKRDLDKQRSDH